VEEDSFDAGLSTRSVRVRMLFTILERCTVSTDVHTLVPLDTTHFSAAIAACLLASDFKSARRVLGIMNDFGMQPSNSSAIARAYAIVAVERAATASWSTRKSRKASKAPQDDISSRARSAYGIVKI
jgi:hypothetical protein